ncbi:hypothetical protein [Trichormus sp. NMC-1]|nr:hypothetical protein [Trichormus sp. NMC-1]
MNSVRSGFQERSLRVVVVSSHHQLRTSQRRIYVDCSANMMR